MSILERRTAEAVRRVRHVGQAITCAPIGNRRKVRGLAIRTQFQLRRHRKSGCSFVLRVERWIDVAKVRRFILDVLAQQFDIVTVKEEALVGHLLGTNRDNTNGRRILMG